MRQIMLDENTELSEQNDFDSIGSETVAPPESNTASVPDTSMDESDQPDAIAETPASQDEQDMFDNLGTDDNNLPTDQESSPPPAVAPISDDAISPSKTETDTDDAETVEDASEAEPTAEDWEAELEDDTEEYIKNLPSENERQRARLAEKGSRMQQSYLNPNCPMDVWLENVENKSPMRFNQMTDAVLAKRNAVSLNLAESDPKQFLGEVYNRTKDGDRSDTYQNLVDTFIDLDPEYAVHKLKEKGIELVKADSTDGSTDLTGSDVENMSDTEIDELTQSDGFDTLKYTHPEDALKLEKILAETKQLRASKTESEKEKETEAQTAERLKQEEIQAAETQKAQEAETQKVQEIVQTFSNVYQSNVTNYVESKLDGDFGLLVTPQEKETDPTAAFLKEAKKALILSGGLDGSGDFDNDLKQWGDSRPAFRQAAQSMIEFSRAGEEKNANAAAERIKPFADAFVQERLKMPEIKMIDEIMQKVAYANQMQNRVRQDFVPDSVGSFAENKGQSEQEMFDNIKA